MNFPVPCGPEGHECDIKVALLLLCTSAYIMLPLVVVWIGYVFFNRKHAYPDKTETDVA